MPEKSDQTSPRGRFKPGQSGNPAGKPRGTRNHVLEALDRIGNEAAQDVLRQAVQAARGGDQRAAEMILSRVWPVRKGRPISLDLPAIQSPADIASAVSIVVAGVAEGRVTPDEGHTIASLLDLQRRAVETADLDARIAALEKRRSDQ